MLPTQEPFLYTVAATATDGVPLDRLEDAVISELDRLRTNGITPQELRKAKNQLRARLVFENDSITNIAHQLGYFETIGTWRTFGSLREQIDAVTVDVVVAAGVERLKPSNLTVGRFETA